MANKGRQIGSYKDAYVWEDEEGNESIWSTRATAMGKLYIAGEDLPFGERLWANKRNFAFTGAGADQAGADKAIGFAGCDVKKGSMFAPVGRV